MSTAILFWIGLALGAGAIVLYFAVLAARPRLVRIVNGLGLFFTGLGLVQAALLARESAAPSWFNANLAIVALSLAVVMQGYSVLRHRGSWDGVDRREERA